MKDEFQRIYTQKCDFYAEYNGSFAKKPKHRRRSRRILKQHDKFLFEFEHAELDCEKYPWLESPESDFRKPKF